MEKLTKILKLELVKKDGSKIDSPNDFLDLSHQIGYNTELNTRDRFNPTHLDIVILDYDGNTDHEEALLINKIYDLGYELYEEKKK